MTPYQTSLCKWGKSHGLPFESLLSYYMWFDNNNDDMSNKHVIEMHCYDSLWQIQIHPLLMVMLTSRHGTASRITVAVSAGFSSCWTYSVKWVCKAKFSWFCWWTTSKLLKKQSIFRWLQTLWRSCDITVMICQMRITCLCKHISKSIFTVGIYAMDKYLAKPNACAW